MWVLHIIAPVFPVKQSMGPARQVLARNPGPYWLLAGPALAPGPGL